MRRALFVIVLSLPALAHKGSDAYWRLAVQGESLEGRLDVAVRDLALLVPLDVDGNGEVTFGELKSRDEEARRVVAQRLSVSLGGAECTLELGGVQVVEHSDGAYATWPLRGACGREGTTLSVGYRLLFDVDAQHRGLVQVSGATGGEWKAFSSSTRALELDVTPPPLGRQTWVAFTEGLHHISIGWDHLCFLFALLLPSVLRREGSRWVPKETLKGTLLEVTKVVTAFTVAHSVTLGLSAFGVLAPNAAFVEVAIAVSVVLAALNTLFAFVTEGRWSLAFGLGLLHGFGFVSALADLGASGGQLWASVLGFNLGVEAGQLAIVACFVPVAFLVRKSAWYPRLVPAGGLGLAIIAAWWTVERISSL